MNKLLSELRELSNKYKKLSNDLGFDNNEEEFYPDSDSAINEGQSQAYWRVHIELDRLIKEYD